MRGAGEYGTYAFAVFAFLLLYSFAKRVGNFFNSEGKKVENQLRQDIVLEVKKLIEELETKKPVTENAQKEQENIAQKPSEKETEVEDKKTIDPVGNSEVKKDMDEKPKENENLEKKQPNTTEKSTVKKTDPERKKTKKNDKRRVKYLLDKELVNLSEEPDEVLVKRIKKARKRILKKTSKKIEDENND